MTGTLDRRRPAASSLLQQHNATAHHRAGYKQPNDAYSPGNPSVSTAMSMSWSHSNDNSSGGLKRAASSFPPRFGRITRPFLYVIDIFVLLFVLQVATMVYLSDGHEGLDNYLPISASEQIPTKQFTSAFQEVFLEGSPSCRLLDEFEVSFSLAIPLAEKDLNKLQHHCRRWGIRAPISIAVWTNLSPKNVLAKLSTSNSTCHPDQLSITTLPQLDASATISKLRNLAIQGAVTTHVVPIEIDMWVSIDLYESLSAPKIIRTLSQDPKRTILLPAFEINAESCTTPKKCQQLIPRNYDDLIVRLGERRIYPMDPKDLEIQGSTKYREWVRQRRGELLDIDCVSSDRFQPFLVVRYCQDLPPFQEELQDSVENGDSRSTWIGHLIRLGYTMMQLGGEFVVYWSDDRLLDSHNNTDGKELKIGPEFKPPSNRISPFVGPFNLRYGKKLQTFLRDRSDFFAWMDQTIRSTQRVIKQCDREAEE